VTVYPTRLSVNYFVIPPSPSATLAHLLYGFEGCQRTGHDDGVYVTPIVAEGPYALESDNVDMVGTRVATDFPMHYVERSEPPLHFIDSWLYVPTDAAGYGGLTSAGGFWVSENVRAASRNPYVSRTALGPEPVRATTYYALVGTGAITRHSLWLPASTFTYGVESCGSSAGFVGVPDMNGWACDPSRWWPNGTVPRWPGLGGIPGDSSTATPYGVTVGQPYRLRDIDCTDESVGAARNRSLTPGDLTHSRCDYVPAMSGTP
jgi:hypothetical protein